MQLSSKPLTEREQEMLCHLRQQLSYKQIAAQCHISTQTVRKHVASICEKHGLDGTDRHALCLRLTYIEISELSRRADVSDSRIDALLESVKATTQNVDGLVECTQNLLTKIDGPHY